MNRDGEMTTDQSATARHLTANERIRVEIVGAPAACGTEVKDRWREVSGWIADQLRRRYGRAVLVEYHDLLDADCPPLPPDAQLPLVLVSGSVPSSGGIRDAIGKVIDDWGFRFPGIADVEHVFFYAATSATPDLVQQYFQQAYQLGRYFERPATGAGQAAPAA